MRVRLEKTVGELPSDIGLTGIQEREKEMREAEMISIERGWTRYADLCQFMGAIQMHGLVWTFPRITSRVRRSLNWDARKWHTEGAGRRWTSTGTCRGACGEMRLKWGWMVSLPRREEVLRKEGESIPLVFREDQQIVEWMKVSSVQPLSCVWLFVTKESHHQLLELTQTQVHSVGDAIQLSHPL